MRVLLYFLIIEVAYTGVFPWVKPAELNRGLPSSIEIWTLGTNASIFNTKLTGAYMRFDMSNANYEFIVKDTNGDQFGYFPKTPIEYASAQQNVVYGVINGGYFDMAKNISASFLAEKTKVKCKNTINEAANKHPTVGAFGVTADGYRAQYIYSFGTDFATYRYNFPNSIPGPIPNPDAGTRWPAIQGIGAGPILVKGGSVIQGNPENFGQASMIDMRHPRSTVCIGYDGYIYFVAIDGRYSGSDGATVSQIAKIMADLYCKDAMNLDGGGSTLLYGNGHILNRPSDPTGPRPVVSAVLIRDRFKKKISSRKIMIN